MLNEAFEHILSSCQLCDVWLLHDLSIDLLTNRFVLLHRLCVDGFLLLDAQERVLWLLLLLFLDSMPGSVA